MPKVTSEPTLIPPGGYIEVIAGDSYQASESRAYEWEEQSSVMAWPSLTSATIKLKARSRYGTKELEATGEVTSNTTPRKVLVELTHTQTEPLLSGGYVYAVVATLSNGHVVTLNRGEVRVVQQDAE